MGRRDGPLRGLTYPVVRGVTDPVVYGVTGISASSAPFVPTDLSSLLAWYDAGDASTITHSGGSVSQWDDKSGNGYHVTQATAAQQPVYSAIDGTIEFDGVNDIMVVLSRMGLAANPDLTVIVDMIKDTVTASAEFTWMFGATPAGIDDTLGGGTGATGFTWRYNGGNRTFGPVTLLDPTIAVWHRSAGDTYGDAEFRENGAQQAETSSVNPGNVPTSTEAHFSIGAAYNPVPSLLASNVILRGVIVLNSNVLSEIQKVEGYLAWDDDREGDLPVGHPYKSSAP